MQITSENLGKRFNREWVFRNLDLQFRLNRSYAITGPNGSGKSTLLQTLTGIIPLTEGKISYFLQDKLIQPDDYYQYLTISAPYQEVIEEFTLEELVDFHLKFKKLREGISREDFFQRIRLASAVKKEIRYYSSGMKQRVKLGLALYTEAPILFLDEPTTNLDAEGIRWYSEEIKNNLKDRIVIVCSNQPYEYDFCDEIIELKKL